MENNTYSFIIIHMKGGYGDSFPGKGKKGFREKRVLPHASSFMSL